MKTLSFILLSLFNCNSLYPSTFAGGGTPKMERDLFNGIGAGTGPKFSDFSITVSGGGPSRATGYFTPDFGRSSGANSIFSHRNLIGAGANPDISEIFKTFEEFESQPSRLEFLLKESDLKDESSGEPNEQQHLKNKKEFINALELLERGETEAVLEDGTVIPLVKMIKEYAEMNFIYK